LEGGLPTLPLQTPVTDRRKDEVREVCGELLTSATGGQFGSMPRYLRVVFEYFRSECQPRQQVKKSIDIVNEAEVETNGVHVLELAHNH